VSFTRRGPTLLQIFICFGGREGENIGSRLRDFLRVEGIGAFLASPKSPDVPAGTDYKQFIEEKLLSSHLMIPICDSAIHKSQPARSEIVKAVQNNIPIIAFVRNNCRAPKEIRNRWVPYRFDPAYPESAFPQLLLGIYRRIDWEREQSEDLSLRYPTGLPLFREYQKFLQRR